MRTNYHTHTTRCNHAIGTDKSFVQSAIEGGFSTLGFSDHTPWPFFGGYVSPIRMRMDQLDGYVASVRRLKEEFKESIDIKVGLECEFYVDHIEWLKEQKDRLELDYLIFGNHYPWWEERERYFGRSSTKEDLREYTDTAIAGMKSGLFNCFAHPELFMRGYGEVDDYSKGVFSDISAAAADLGVVMERNTSMEFHPELWEIVAEHGCRVIVGMDAHNRKILKCPEIYDDGCKEIESLGITPIKHL